MNTLNPLYKEYGLYKNLHFEEILLKIPLLPLRLHLFNHKISGKNNVV